MITIDQQVIIVNRRPILASPKTFSSLRDVPMPVFLSNAIAGHAKQFSIDPSGVLVPDAARFPCTGATTSTARSGSQPLP